MDKWQSAYIDVAERFASLSTARRLKVGAIVVKDNQILFHNVEVLWPRLDMPYKQNNATGQWDKCASILEEDGKYEVIIKFQPQQAQELYNKMLQIFNFET